MNVCTPPEMASYVAAGGVFTGLAMLMVLFVVAMTAADGDLKRRHIPAVVAVVATTLALTVGVPLLTYKAANADYDRCEQRARVTVGGQR